MSKILVVPGAIAAGAPISHGHRCFEPWREDITDPNSRWLVEVPDESVDHFCRVGGFYVYSQPTRRRLSGKMAPLTFRDGASPSSVGFDGDTYNSELVRFPDGRERHLIAFPEEGLEEILSHPGYSVLSMSDHQEEKSPVHPGESYELAEWFRANTGKNTLQGGGFYHLDLFPKDRPDADDTAHPDGVPDQVKIAEAKRVAAEEREREAVERASRLSDRLERAERLLAEAEVREAPADQTEHQEHAEHPEHDTEEAHEEQH